MLSGAGLLAIMAFQLLSADPFLERLYEKLRRYRANYPEEKLYVQTDKPFYAPGDDIWFNAFLLDATSHKPSAVSDVVHVELIDPKGQVALTASLLVLDGTAHGDFHLDEAMPGGLYRLRAYTRWMKNFGEDTYFIKDVPVQRIVAPRLLLKLDFEKEAYGPGDTVVATLEAADLKNVKAAQAPIDYTVQLAGALLLRATSATLEDGSARITFRLPNDLTVPDGLLNVIVATDGVTESVSRAIPIVLNKITLRFFPEGGQQIMGVPGRVAFQATNEFGKGADVSGVIVDKSNRVVTPFSSIHMGMGSFAFTPVAGESYFARIERPVTPPALIPLPTPMERGYSFNMQEKDSTSVTWTIHAPEEGIVYMIAQAHGELLHTEKASVVKGKNTWRLQTNSFPRGICVFTLFDAQGIAQAERLVFLQPSKGLRIQLITNKERYEPRDQVRVDIRTTDFTGKPVRAKLSLAAVDDKIISFADDKQDNLLSQMLLSSEVRGKIQEPSFYFDPAEPHAPEALDHLLMTQGWRRFTWQAVLDSTRNITFAPEKTRTIAGTVVNDSGQGMATTVTLIEAGGRRRIVNVETTADGHFVFKNIDPTVNILLITRKPGVIVMQKNAMQSISHQSLKSTGLLPDVQGEVDEETETSEGDVAEETTVEDLDLTFSQDVSQLSEVVITGLGVEEARNVTGTMVRVQNAPGAGFFSTATFEDALTGRIPGVMVRPQTGNPGASTTLTLRGVSSLGSGGNEPLYVIDGYPLAPSLNRNFANGSVVDPADIESIHVINSPEATAIYGSRGANGVISIVTKSNLGYRQVHAKTKPPRYNSVLITPRGFTQVREFYQAPPERSREAKRDNFKTTVFWHHSVVTDEAGEAHVSFYHNDAVSAFRITAEGFSTTGLLGRAEHVYHTELPLSLDIKLPAFLGFEDVLRLPVSIRNESPVVRTVQVTLNLPDALQVTESVTRQVSIQPRSSTIVYYTISSRGVAGKFPLTVEVTSGRYNDQINHVLQVRPTGFPRRASFAAKALDNTFALDIRDPEKNSVHAEMAVYPDLLGELFSGAEAILREPHGCFEQVSSSTFPNILALQFMQESRQINEQRQRDALRYIRMGYQQLMAYEIKGGGFEWFGLPPAHEGLTAYGLVQFHEMKKVFSGVSDDVITRTRGWLMQRRDGKGGFHLNPGKYGFSGASPSVTNAYIVYALSETGEKDIMPEYRVALAEAIQSKDMYRMALLAHSAMNLHQPDDYIRLLTLFQEQVNLVGVGSLKAEHSIVRSSGTSLLTETLSLWALAIMKGPEPDMSLVQECIQQILSSRVNGQFGSTQGTTLALKALTELGKRMNTQKQDGSLVLSIGDQLVNQIDFTKDARGKLTSADFADKLSRGAQTLHAQFKGVNEPIPYSIDIVWYSKLPDSDDRCPLNLTTRLSTQSVRQQETVRLQAVLTNKTSGGLPMAVAVIGIPPGLSVQPWQLKELQEKSVFDFYEIMNGNLVIYYREMAPGGRVVVNLDLKADIPGTYTGTASCAYLYYTQEHRVWTHGNSINID